jgi:hypothetical protein
MRALRHQLLLLGFLAMSGGGQGALAGMPAADAAGAPAAKRVAPSPVRPVTIAGIRYEAVLGTRSRSLPQEGGYVAAIDAGSGRELWLQRIYETHYDPALEEDVQDVFIRRLRAGPGGKTLEILDELGRRYTLDLATRESRPISKNTNGGAGKSSSPSSPPGLSPIAYHGMRYASRQEGRFAAYDALGGNRPSVLSFTKVREFQNSSASSSAR